VPDEKDSAEMTPPRKGTNFTIKTEIVQIITSQLYNAKK
jgi:hypothetical protein